MKKTYFVHIPKTAGNSIRKVLQQTPYLANPGWGKNQREHHFASRNATRAVGSHLSFTTDKFPCYLDDPAYKDSSSTFMSARNPFGLLYSYYIHYVDLRNTPKKWLDDGWANVNGYHKINSFEQFIDIYTSIDPEDWHVPSLCKNLFGQIFCDDGKCRVDDSIFVENLSSGIELVLKKFVNTSDKIDCNKFPHANKSPRSKKSYVDVYNDTMIKKVAKKCEWELDNFKYSFNSKSDRAIMPLNGMSPK